MSLDFVQCATISMAAVGATLGFINTWNTLVRQRVKLVIRPAGGWETPSFDPTISVEVINLSNFAVTINEVGLERQDKKRYVSIRPMSNGKSLPQRLEARESITASFPLQGIDASVLGRAFAKTSCGEMAWGDSPSLNRIRQGTSPLLKELAERENVLLR